MSFRFEMFVLKLATLFRKRLRWGSLSQSLCVAIMLLSLTTPIMSTRASGWSFLVSIVLASNTAITPPRGSGVVSLETSHGSRTGALQMWIH